LVWDSIKNRFQSQKESFDGLLQAKAMKSTQARDFQSKRKNFSQALSVFLKQNHNKGLTQNQIDQLKKQLDAMDGAIAGYQKAR
jgi:hypothetical protein